MTNKDQDMRPCPFCGEEEKLYVRHMEGTIIHPTYCIQCDECGARGGWTDRGDHVEAWNGDDLTGKVVALKKVYCHESDTGK